MNQDLYLSLLLFIILNFLEKVPKFLGPRFSAWPDGLAWAWLA